MSKNTKKPILAENTVRRFMKLASIDTLSDGFVNETYKMEEEEMNEMGDYEEGMHKDKMEEQEDEMGATAEEEAEIEMPDEAPTDEAAEEVTISDDEAEALIDAHNAADEVVAKLEDAMAGEEPEAEEAEEEAAEEGEEEEAEEEMPPMDADLMEGEEVMEELYEAALSGLNIDIEQKSKEELVNEVKKAIFQRVVRRLIKESKSK